MLDRLDAALHWLLPRVCLLCGFDSHDPLLNLCAHCAQQLPWITDSCYKCGAKIKTSAEAILCELCTNVAPPFDRVCAVFRYTPPLNVLINNLKFSSQLYPAQLFARLLYRKIIECYSNRDLPQVLIPVPLHIKRYQHRGYNQVIEFCAPLSKMLQLPMDINACYRTVNTLAQSKLSRAQRLLNVKQAFMANHLSYDHVAIVDDVVTTGSTVRALSLVLQAKGVQQVDVWCVCRG